MDCEKTHQVVVVKLLCGERREGGRTLRERGADEGGGDENVAEHTGRDGGLGGSGCRREAVLGDYRERVGMIGEDQIEGESGRRVHTIAKQKSARARGDRKVGGVPDFRVRSLRQLLTRQADLQPYSSDGSRGSFVSVRT